MRQAQKTSYKLLEGTVSNIIELGAKEIILVAGGVRYYDDFKERVGFSVLYGVISAGIVFIIDASRCFWGDYSANKAENNVIVAGKSFCSVERMVSDFMIAGLVVSLFSCCFLGRIK